MSDEKVFPEPVIVPLDELMEKFAMVPLEVVRKSLAVQGLYVIGPAENAVLSAARAYAQEPTSSHLRDALCSAARLASEFPRSVDPGGDNVIP